MPRIQHYQLAAVALSFGLHVWFAHSFAIKRDMQNTQNAQRPISGMASNVFTLRLINAEHVSGLQGSSLTPPQSLESGNLAPQPQIEAVPIPPDRNSPMPYYFRAQELTSPLRLLQDVRATQNLHLSGKTHEVVILRLLVNESGDIDRVVVEDSDLPADATDLLIEKFSKMQFDPGKIGNLSVKSQLTIEVDVNSSD